MGEIFLSLLSMSMRTSIIIVVIMLFRLILQKKTPKWFFPVLWGIAGLRLIIPYTITWNILPVTRLEGILPVITGWQNNYVNQSHNLPFSVQVQHSLADTIGIVWLVGCSAMLVYMLYMYIRISFRVKDAIHIKDNIYKSESVKSAFVFGFIHPRVLINVTINEKDIDNIILHEKAHITRADHIIKPLAFILVSFYWFNPFIWIAYSLFNKDVELACDEKVIRNMDRSERAEYAQTLLNYKKREHAGVILIQTFGGNNMKKRIIFVLDFCKVSKKMGCISVIVMILICLLSAVTLGATIKEAESSNDAEPPLISFAEFDDAELTEDEYLCCIEGVTFLIRIYKDSLYYTFRPSTTQDEMKAVADGIREGMEKARKDIWAERIFTNKIESMEHDNYQENKALCNFIDSIVLK